MPDYSFFGALDSLLQEVCGVLPIRDQYYVQKKIHRVSFQICFKEDFSTASIMMTGVKDMRFY